MDAVIGIALLLANLPFVFFFNTNSEAAEFTVCINPASTRNTEPIGDI